MNIYRKTMFIFLLGLFFILPFNARALTFDFDNKKFSQLTFDELMEYEYSFINSNYDKVFCVQMSTTALDCYFGLTGYDLVVNTESSYLRVRNVVNGQTDSHNPYIRVNNSSSTSPLVSASPFPSINSTVNNILGKTVVYSNFDLYNFADNTLYFAKNVDFTPPSASCEECEECDETVNTALYTLMILVSTLILMIFLKWTFGDRRR